MKGRNKLEDLAAGIVAASFMSASNATFAYEFNLFLDRILPEVERVHGGFYANILRYPLPALFVFLASYGMYRAFVKARDYPLQKQDFVVSGPVELTYERPGRIVKL